MSKSKTATAVQPDLLGDKPAETVKPKPTVAANPAPKKTQKVVALKQAKPKSQAVALVKETPPTNLLQVIFRASTNKDVDVPKMQALLAMQQDIERRDEERAFNEALLAARAEMPIIVRDKINTHTKKKYPSLENISKVVDPIARKHGIMTSFGMADSPIDKHYRVVCDASKGGHTHRFFMDLEADKTGSQGSSNKTAIQAVSSTTTYARRYLKTMIFDLTIEGDDDDGEAKRKTKPAANAAPTELTPDQVKKLLDAIQECGVGIDGFCEHYGIEKVADLPPAKFEAALAKCDTHTKNRKVQQNG